MNNYRKGLKKRRKRSYGEINENLLTKKRFEVAEKGYTDSKEEEKCIQKTKQRQKNTTSDR